MKPSLSSTLTALTLIISTTSAVQLCEQFGYFPTTMGFEFNNNMWGLSDDAAGTQCLYIDSTQPSGVAWHTDWDWGTSSASPGGATAEYVDSVKAYPYSGVAITEKKLVSDINGMPTSVSWDYWGTNVRADVSYDMFTSADPNHDPSSGDYEMMIWLGNMGGVSPIGQSVGTAPVDGLDWDLWIGYNGPTKVFSFMAPQEPLEKFNSDIKQFFDYITTNQGFPATSQYLLTTQFGTEPFSGTGQFNVYHWSVAQY